MIKIQLLKNIIVYCITLILLYYVYTLFNLSSLLLYIYHFIIPIIIAIFIHFIIDPIIEYFSSDRLKRKYVVILLFMLLLLGGLILLYYVIPYILDSSLLLYQSIKTKKFIIPPSLSSIITYLNQFNILALCMDYLNKWTVSFVTCFRYLIVGLGISFYLSYDNIHVIDRLIVYIPFTYQGLCMQTLKRIKIVTYRFIKSLFKDFILFFIMSSLLFLFIDPSLFIIIAFILSLTNLIPYIGPILGGIPIVLYEYIQSETLGLYALLAIIVLQYIESSYIQPFLFSKTTHVHPIFLILSLIFFSDIFGIVGMIFSPIFLLYIIYIYKLLVDLKVFLYIQRKIVDE